MMMSKKEEREKLRSTMKKEEWECYDCGNIFPAGTLTDHCRREGDNLVLVCEDCFLSEEEE